MQSETLPVSTQPDEPPHVVPCHTGKAARVCARDVALIEAHDSCPYCHWDYVHAPWCPTRGYHRSGTGELALVAS